MAPGAARATGEPAAPGQVSETGDISQVLDLGERRCCRPGGPRNDSSGPTLLRQRRASAGGPNVLIICTPRSGRPFSSLAKRPVNQARRADV